MKLLKDRGFVHPRGSEITPRRVFEQRRALLQAIAAGGGGALALWAARDARAAMGAAPGRLAALPGARSAVDGATTMEKVTAYADGGFKNVKLSDYRGKWVTLCFYPGDFTFV